MFQKISQNRFVPRTGELGYPQMTRHDDGRTMKRGTAELDNRWLVG